MGNVVIDMSMSVDGFIAAPNDNPEQGLGEDGMRLHNWAFDDPSVFERVYGNLVKETGAVIMGRRSYDNSIEAWGGKGPMGDVPCFVVTHRPLADADPVFTVVTDGIESALAKAQEVAGDKRIGIMGANVDQQFLAAGLVDEIRIHLVNVLLGGGRPLFDRLPQRIELEQTGLTETDGVTHLEYRVVRSTRKGRTIMTMTETTTTRTLDVPGATLTYDVRGGGSGDAPALFLIGSPMGAAGFGSLAGHFTDRPIMTYDPRGVERSEKTDPASPSTPEEHADDLHRLIQELGAGPVDLFASSGGAVNALALVARHPEDVRTLVAHEPPLASVLPDRQAALAACRDIHETYRRSGMGPAMAKFIAIVSHKGPIPADYVDQPAPDPQMFGLPTDDDGSRDDALLGQNILSCTHYEPDVDALRAASTRIVIAPGAESEGELANRAAFAVAERLGMEPVIFPSNHGGFLGGEYGQTGDPDAFAAKLRQVLTDA